MGVEEGERHLRNFEIVAINNYVLVAKDYGDCWQQVCDSTSVRPVSAKALKDCLHLPLPHLPLPRFFINFHL